MTSNRGEHVIPEKKINLDIVNTRLDEAIKLANFANRPCFVLVAFPRITVNIPNLFKSRNENIVVLFDNPPALRRSGFDMVGSEMSQNIGGELRRINLPNYQIRELWRDGTLIFAVPADKEFLCWGKGDILKINTLALVELTYLFVDFLSKISKHCVPISIDYSILIKLNNLYINNYKVILIPFPVGSFGFMHMNHKKEAPTKEFIKIIEITLEPLNIGKICYDIIKEIYLWFGFDEDNIPYAKEESGITLIDREQIISAGN